MSNSLLLVDDNEFETTGLAAALVQAGYLVSLATDGQEALALLRTQRFDLVLLDMMMPNIDGWKFMEERKRDPALRPVAVLIITGLSIASETWARNLGAVGLIKKPVELDKLLATLQLVLS